MATLCFKWGLNQIFEKPQATYGNWRLTRLFLPRVKGIKWLICVGPSPGGSSWSSHSRSWTVRVTLIHTSSAGCWQALFSKPAGAGRWGGYIGFVFPLDSIWHLYNLGTCLICDLWALGEPTQNVSLLRDLTFGNFYPRTRVELPQSTEAPQEETGPSSFYWTPAVCCALFRAPCMCWHSYLCNIRMRWSLSSSAFKRWGYWGTRSEVSCPRADS